MLSVCFMVCITQRVLSAALGSFEILESMDYFFLLEKFVPGCDLISKDALSDGTGINIINKSVNNIPQNHSMTATR